MKSKIPSANSWMLFVLFVITFYPLLFTGYLTADDMHRHLEVMTGGLLHGAWGLAESTGRINLYFHIILTHIPYSIDNYIYRKLFLIIPHIVVLIIFSITLKRYVSSKAAATLFCVLFLAFFTNSYEHNLYASYPFAFHVSITAIILSGYYLHRYMEAPCIKDLLFTVALYCIAIFTYEQFVIFMVFFLAFILLTSRKRPYPRSHQFKIAFAFITTTAIYIFIAYMFKQYSSGSYSGTTLASFDFIRIVQTLWTFVASAFPLDIPFRYVNRIHHEYATFNYSICSILENLNLLWAIKATIVCILTIKILASSDYMPASRMKVLKQSGSLLILLVISTLPISLSEKYQSWVINSGTLAYSSSSYVAQICAAGAMALLLLFAANSAFRKSYSTFFYGLVVVCLSYVVLVTEMHNKDVLAEQRNSANKWAAIDSLYRSGALNKIPEESLLYAPSFINTGGIAYASEGYWSAFLNIKYNINVKITDKKEKLCDPKYINKKFVLKYSSAYPHKKFIAEIEESTIDKPFITIPDDESTGFYGIEYRSDDQPFRWSKKASSLVICNPSDVDSRVALSATIQTVDLQNKSLSICFSDVCEKYMLDNTRIDILRNLLIPPGKHYINLETNALPVNAPNDPRKMYFSVSDLKIKVLQ